jgi:hypothetical protein
MDRWAERDQRRLEAAQARPARGSTRWGRALNGFITIVIVVTRVAFFVGSTIWIVTLLAHPSVRAYVLALALLMLTATSAFTTAAFVSARRAAGRNPFTGMPRRRR